MEYNRTPAAGSRTAHTRCSSWVTRHHNRGVRHAYPRLWRCQKGSSLHKHVSKDSSIGRCGRVNAGFGTAGEELRYKPCVA